MARSLAHLSFLLLVASTALAVRDLPEAIVVVDTLEEACGETQFPDLCVRWLLAYPDSRTASPRRLAELSVLAALDAGRDAAEFAHSELNGVSEEDGLLGCLDSCSDDVEEAVAHLSALSREPTDARFLEVQSWLSATLGGTAAYDAVCRDAPDSDVKDAALAKAVEFDMLLRIALDLITEASGSMSATVVLPPSDHSADAPAPLVAPSYGGAYGAPPYGRRQPRPRPRAPAPAPSKGYGAGLKPRAPAPSPFKGFVARKPHAPDPAPAPFKGYGGARKPRAPAPSPFLARKPRAPAPAPAPFKGYGGSPRPRAPAPAPFLARKPRAPAPSPFKGYGGARKPRAPAPAPFVARKPRAPAPPPLVARKPRAPAPAPSRRYGGRRPRVPAPTPYVSAPRPRLPTPPPPRPTFASILETEETA